MTDILTGRTILLAAMLLAVALIAWSAVRQEKS
jgi:hypothetical protein